VLQSIASLFTFGLVEDPCELIDVRSTGIERLGQLVQRDAQAEANRRGQVIVMPDGTRFYPSSSSSSSSSSGKRKTRKQRGGVQNLTFYEELKRVDPIFYLAYEVASVKLFCIAVTQKTPNVLSELII